MRVPIAVTVLLIAAAAGLGWHNRQTLASLRVEQRKLAGQAVPLGISTDSNGITRLTKRPREDRAAEARRVAANFIAYGLEMKALGDKLGSPDKATRERMMAQMDEVISLDAEQLKILIGEVRTAPGIDGHVQLSLLRFALERLAKDHPREALAMLTPEMLELLGRTNGLVEGLIQTATAAWAMENPRAALGWYRENRDTLLPNARDSAGSALISGTAQTDLRLALQLFGEFGKDPENTVPSLIAREGQTPIEKQASLAILREWIPEVKDSEVREKVFYESLCQLVLGKGNRSADFDSVTRWVAEAKLTGKEMELFTRGDLLDFSYYVKPAETGKWTEWLGVNFPEEDASRQIWNIFTRWAGGDFQAAGEWLATAADGMAKNTAICAYADTVVKYDPQAALRWLVTLPPGKQREESFQQLYDDWPKKDPAAKQAAEAFAKTYGVK